MRGVLFPMSVRRPCCLFLTGGRRRAEDSYLYQPAFGIDHVLRGPAEALHAPARRHHAAAGPLRLLARHALHGPGASTPTAPPSCSRAPTGPWPSSKSGPNDTQWVEHPGLLPHLGEYEAIGRVWIRRRKVPLTPEQSCRLTEFAMAPGRQALRPDPPRRATDPLPPPRADPHAVRRQAGRRPQELLLLRAGLRVVRRRRHLDPERTRPSATYPHDLFFGRSYNPFIDKHLDINCGWHPPARWVSKLPGEWPDLPGGRP